jgi:serine/threonine-protein kinase
VPRALGELCLRMLHKQPGERFADAWALEAAVEEVLKQADAAWEVPLGEAWGPHLATTVGQPDNPPLTGGEWAALRERLDSYEKRLVRGRPLSPQEALPAVPEAEPPGSEPVPAGAGVPPSAPAPGAGDAAPVRGARRGPASARRRSAHPTGGDTPSRPTSGVLFPPLGAGRPGSGAPLEAARR